MHSRPHHRPQGRLGTFIALTTIVSASIAGVGAAGGTAGAAPMPLDAGDTLTVNVPDAAGGATVVGNLAVVRPDAAGFVTAYACADGLPVDDDGNITKADINFAADQVVSNRLIAEADANGDVCFYTSAATDLVVDINGLASGIDSVENRRTDTRSGERIAGGGELQINVPEAVGGGSVVGNLAAVRPDSAGFVTSYPCADGVPTDSEGNITKADLNYAAGAVGSNRLIAQADTDGNVCFTSSAGSHLVVDINGIAPGIDSSRNFRTDTRDDLPPVSCSIQVGIDNGVPFARTVCDEQQPAPRQGAGTALEIDRGTRFAGDTMVGNVAVVAATAPGFITAYPCDEGVPTDANGNITRADLNYRAGQVVSNRLIVRADEGGDVCFYTSADAHIVVDLNGTAPGISSIDNLRTDTRR